MTRDWTTFQRIRLVMGLGMAQLIAWGTLYYTIAVLAEPMRRELALSQTAVYAAFSLSLGLAGALTPWAGRLVDRHGGRVVLAASTLCGAGHRLASCFNEYRSSRVTPTPERAAKQLAPLGSP